MAFLILCVILQLICGIPIGYAIGLSSLVYVVFLSDMSPLVIAQQIPVGADNMVLLALPFFLLAGEIMDAAGITQRLTRLAMAVIGPLPGGLSLVVVIANLLIAMVSGAAIASAAAIGSTMIPMMTREGYTRGYAAAINSVSATIGPVIPPSVGFIIYASVSGASVGKLFLAGTIPGILMACSIMGLCMVLALRQGHPRSEAICGLREILERTVSALPGLMMPVVILGGIFGVLVTPTEAGVLAVAYGLIVGLFVYRSISFSVLPQILLRTAVRSTSILFIISSASCFGFIISRDVDQNTFVELIRSISDAKWLVMLMAMGVFLLLGTVMEGGSIMIIFTPLLLPVLHSYEIDIVQFGVVFQLAIMVGLLTPPVGILLYVISGVGKVSVKDILANLWPFYILLLGVMLLVAYIPQLSLFLVDYYGDQIK